MKNSQIKNYVTIGIIGVLMAIIILQRACTPSVGTTDKDTVVVTKIVYVPVHDTIYTDPKIVIRKVPSKPLPPQYLPDTNYVALKKQYEKLVIAHLTENVYVDKLNLDTLGSITIKDTTQFNMLKKRRYQLDLRIPRRVDSVYVTNTVLAPSKRQVYLGIGANTTQTLGTLGLRGSVLYKDKKDNMFSPSVTINTNGSVIYGIDTYFKLKLK
jgi:hypothetical protein